MLNRNFWNPDLEQLSETPAGNGVIYKAKPLPTAGEEWIPGASPAHPQGLTSSFPKNLNSLKPEWKPCCGAGQWGSRAG